MRNLGTREITCRGILLRKFCSEDSQDMFDNYCNDSDVCKFITWKPHGNIETTTELLKNWIEQYDDTTYRWAIIIDGQVVGSIDLVSIDIETMKGVIGYCLSKNYWNRGIMTRALGLVIDYCINEVGFKRLEAIHHIDNVGSEKVMLKNNMIFDEIIQGKHRNSQGKYVDVKSYYIEKSF